MNDWYKLSSTFLIFGKIEVRGSLNVSKTRIIAANKIITDNTFFK